MSSLYELTQNTLMLQEMLESGEIDEDIFNDTLESMGVAEKAENVCKMIRHLEARAEAFKVEKARLAERQSVCENGIKRLKESLLLHLNTLDKPKIEAGLFTVSKSKSKSVEITGLRYLDEKYLEAQPPKVLKSKIAADLKNGVKVEGAEFVETEYVTIR